MVIRDELSAGVLARASRNSPDSSRAADCTGAGKKYIPGESGELIPLLLSIQEEKGRK